MTDRQTVRFLTLGRMELERYIDALIQISADVSPWTKENFLVDLPKKWEASFVAMYDEPVGYVILSQKQEGALHIHQFMVAPAMRGSGVGEAMIVEAKRRSLLFGGHLSLKVADSAAGAQRFYRRHAFSDTRRERDYIWMSWSNSL